MRITRAIDHNSTPPYARSSCRGGFIPLTQSDACVGKSPILFSLFSARYSPINCIPQNINLGTATLTFLSPSTNLSNVALECNIALVVCATPPKTAMMLNTCTELPLIHIMKTIIAIELTDDFAKANARCSLSLLRSRSIALSSIVAAVVVVPVELFVRSASRARVASPPRARGSYPGGYGTGVETSFPFARTRGRTAYDPSIGAVVRFASISSRARLWRRRALLSPTLETHAVRTREGCAEIRGR